MDHPAGTSEPMKPATPRKRQYDLSPAATHELLRELLTTVPVIHLAGTGRSGDPVLRTVHGVLVGDVVAFHGAPAGEKMECLGRPVVLGVEDIVASIPSYFVDPERACPATTYYRSVHVHGVLEEVTDVEGKAAVLRALLAKHQPEGGHVPLTAKDPLYAKAVAGLLVVHVDLRRAHVVGKAKLGQNRTPRQRAAVVAALRERARRGGGPADERAAALVEQAARASEKLRADLGI